MNTMNDDDQGWAHTTKFTKEDHNYVVSEMHRTLHNMQVQIHVDQCKAAHRTGQSGGAAGVELILQLQSLRDVVSRSIGAQINRIQRAAE